MRMITILINGKSYDINLETGIVRTYMFSKGGDESGDIEGYEDVGKIIGDK